MKSGAFKIALVYTIAGILWIALSDKVLDMVKGSMDVSFVLFLGAIKGFAYVILTGVLLYKFISKHNSLLEQSEKQYRSYFEENPSPMWIYNRRTLNFTAVNNAAVAYYGYSPEEFKRMTILDIGPKADKSKVHNVIKNLKDGYNDSGIWTHLKKNGMPIQVKVTSHNIKSGTEEHIMAMATQVETSG